MKCKRTNKCWNKASEEPEINKTESTHGNIQQVVKEREAAFGGIRKEDSHMVGTVSQERRN